MGPQGQNPKSQLAKQDSPYCAFKNDRDRLWALVSRDVRLVILGTVFACAGAGLSKWGMPHWVTAFFGA